MPCRLNHQRTWLGKLILEALVSSYTSFVTLTYNDESLPRSPEDGVPILYRRDLTLFIKRFRKHFPEFKFRYYACGEYGDQFGRPHYHMIMYSPIPLMDRADEMAEIWGNGFVSVYEGNEQNYRYVSKYCLKKMGLRDERRDGRPVEFAGSSLRPGIGAPALPSLIKAMEPYREKIQQEGDVFSSFHYKGKYFPFDPWIMDKLRLHFDIPRIAAMRPSHDAPWDFEIKEAEKVHRKLAQKYMVKK
jgi:hypothetical protein